jgi:thiol-disulfide isomerase/thioredoxin
LTLSCEGPAENGVGDMADFSYGGRKGRAYGPSATGEAVDLSQYRGRFVWVDFSAPWCGPCNGQAPALQKLEQTYAGKVVFLTLLQSDRDPRAPATERTARLWSSRYRLDPAHVAASTEGQRTVPTHIVFSPLGQTLYMKAGLHTEAHARSCLERVMRHWTEWYAENENSLSVMLGEIGDGE